MSANKKHSIKKRSILPILLIGTFVLFLASMVAIPLWVTFSAGGETNKEPGVLYSLELDGSRILVVDDDYKNLNSTTQEPEEEIVYPVLENETEEVVDEKSQMPINEIGEIPESPFQYEIIERNVQVEILYRGKDELGHTKNLSIRRNPTLGDWADGALYPSCSLYPKPVNLNECSKNKTSVIVIVKIKNDYWGMIAPNSWVALYIQDANILYTSWNPGN